MNTVQFRALDRAQAAAQKAYGLSCLLGVGIEGLAFEEDPAAGLAALFVETTREAHAAICEAMEEGRKEMRAAEGRAA